MTTHINPVPSTSITLIIIVPILILHPVVINSVENGILIARARGNAKDYKQFQALIGRPAPDPAVIPLSITLKNGMPSSNAKITSTPKCHHQPVG